MTTLRIQVTSKSDLTCFRNEQCQWCMSVCLSVGRSVGRSVRPSVHPSVCPSAGLSVCSLPVGLQIFVTDIFKVKIDLSLELMNCLFIEKPYSQWINSRFRPQDPKDKIWHRKIWRRISFQMNAKLSYVFWTYEKRKKKNLVPEKHVFTK